MLQLVYKSIKTLKRVFKMIRKGSTVAYKTFINDKKYCGLGKVIEINKENNTCIVADYYTYYTCLLSDCENTKNW